MRLDAFETSAGARPGDPQPAQRTGTMNSTNLPRPVGEGPIFLVDDDLLDLRLAQRCHAKSGIRRPLKTFDSGAALLQHLEDYPADRPSFILVDVSMPEMKGFEVVRRMKALDALSAETPIAMLTTCQIALDQQLARDAGCAGCLTKPGAVDAFARIFGAWGP